MIRPASGRDLAARFPLAPGPCLVGTHLQNSHRSSLDLCLSLILSLSFFHGIRGKTWWNLGIQFNSILMIDGADLNLSEARQRTQGNFLNVSGEEIIHGRVRQATFARMYDSRTLVAIRRRTGPIFRKSMDRSGAHRKSRRGGKKKKRERERASDWIDRYTMRAPIDERHPTSNS